MSLPPQPTNENAKQYQFSVGLRKGFIRHLFAGNSRDIEKVSQPNVALSHFHEKVLLLNAQHIHGSQFIKNIDAELGQAVGMKGIDIIDGSKAYYALPNQSLRMAEAFIDSKEVIRFESGLEMMSPTRISSSSKRALREAELLIKSTKEANLISENKILKKKEEDIKIRCSFTEAQEKYIKRVLKDHKVEVDHINSKLADIQQKCDESEKKLALEIDGKNVMVRKHKCDIDTLYSSGLQRGLILTDSWHEKNSTVCLHLFGFLTFDEYKIYCKCLFPDLKLSYGTKNTDIITEWEKCTMVKMRMRRGTTYEMIGSIWSRNTSSVGIYIKDWAPRWEVVGSYLSDLDLTQEYLDAERPQIFRDAAQDKVAILVDGKDFMIDDPKKNSAMKKAVWSDKVHHSAARIITWSTPAGLTVEHTPLFMGRATESAIVSLWGSYHSTVPLTQVPEIPPSPLIYVKTEKYEERCPLFRSVVKEGRNKGPDNDDDEGNDAAELDDAIAEAEADNGTQAPPVHLTERGQNFLRRMRQRASEDKPCKKYSADAVVECNHLLLRGGPNQSSTTKLNQLNIHETLHVAYKEGKLHKCQLSYYLNEMEPLRAKMIKHLIGEAGMEIPPSVFTKLAKIPVGGTVLADRGFYFDAPSYPNVNAQVTPHFLTGREQFESSEISSDLVTCRLRWSSEAVFSRVTDHNALTDVIPYSYFSIMTAMIEWGHAHANLMQPFNKPSNY